MALLAKLIRIYNSDFKRTHFFEMEKEYFTEEAGSKRGPFKSYYEKLRNSINEEGLLKFEELKTDEERIKFLNNIAVSVVKIVDEVNRDDKDLEQAKNFKELGNKSFVEGKIEEALKLYTQSLIKLPFNNVSTSYLAIILANRSACLYHLEEYKSAINDIDYALSLEYPMDLRYKIHERKAKCLLAEQNHEEAIKEFRNTIQALDVSRLAKEKKLKMQTDIQIMLEVMTRPKTKSGHINDFRPKSNNEKKMDLRLDLASNRHKVYASMCDKVDIKEEEGFGRFAVAEADINPGDVLLSEKPHSFVLLQEFSHTHCQHCFKRTLAPYSCAACTRVIFCSRECRTEAEASYHKYECPVLDILQSSGFSVTVLMAVRIIAEKPLSFFLSMRNKLSDERKALPEYRSSDYEAVYHLVRHENLRARDDFFERTAVAYFLLQCLKKTDYFSQSGNGENSMAEHFIGSLILRHLQLLQFNAHEIFETELENGKKLEGAKSVFIGGGLFPTLSLFNHSCDPGVVRYFDGTAVIVRAINFISKGEVVAENYGPIFTNARREERRAKLSGQYWFHCECKPCIENWPTIDEMDRTIFRFRCDSRRADGQKFNSCSSILVVPQSTNEFMVKCPSCGQHTNILKNLKALQDTDAMYKQATRDGEKGNYVAALNIYLEILSTLNEIMAPPFEDYHLCQQAIRTCMLCLGNKFVKKN